MSITRLVRQFWPHADNIIIISRHVLDLLGGDYITTAVLGQLVYWTNIMESSHADFDGWIYKSGKEWVAEASINERPLRRATGILVDLGLLQTALRKVNGAPTTHYLLDFDALADWLMGDAYEVDSAQNTKSIHEKVRSPTSSKTTAEIMQAAPAHAVSAKSKRTVEKRTQAGDPLWDALVEIKQFAPASDTPEHGRWNKAVGIYRKLGYGPDDIRKATGLYHRVYPGMSDGALAVAGHAQELLSSPTRASPSVNGWGPSPAFTDYDDE